MFLMNLLIKIEKIRRISCMLCCCLFMQTFSIAQKYTFNRPKMGSPFIITVYADDSAKLLEIIDLAYRRVDTLNQIFSDYLATSEINTLCNNQKPQVWQPISPDLFHILQLSKAAYDASGGAYDVTIAPVVRLWRKARKEKALPNETELKLALSKVGFKHLELDKSPKIRFYTEGVSLDFGGIVKGFAAQEVVNLLTINGFPICFADAGGDLAMGASPVSEGGKTNGWRVGISVPNEENQIIPQFLHLQNQAVATSGDLYQSVEINRKTYSHIVNPKTGLGLTHRRNVTVIAPDGAQADWLATACSVLSIKKAMKLVRKYPNVELLIMENRKGKIKYWQSTGFSKYFRTID
jgi:FAD:protein FMN transferase